MKPVDHKDKETQNELDALVLNIELTLISIIQGVALYFLTENARQIFVQKQWMYSFYVATALLVILLFWSRSIIHALTVIRWPLKFGHNFLYVAATLVEAVSFNQLANPLNWFLLQALFSILLWLLFFIDLDIIRKRMEDSEGPAGNALYRLVRKEQVLNIAFLFPANILFNVACYWLIGRYPAFFIGREGHFLLSMLQATVAAGYLFYGIYFYQKLIPRIAKTRREWRDDALIES